MDVDYDKDNYSHGHGGFRPGAGRKRKEVTTSIQALVNDDPVLKGSINNLKNADKYEKAGKQEDDEDDDDINMDVLDGTD
ncbi:unnamed protein product [Didymodactylos carnosus]|uniref:Uncharacterized protein n=1 Tax=Didymodactylos carnosus TaxID=1234261 RepID=A0A814UWI8_9BILA|nr:unnamed protein product [Didymodactylos carnosus]CAF1180231.1 unnamed protein product [Didymodactylos carnosus]CAF3799686.1 unnamed protein product [Didymodactylos carnosus]CAF3944510.1 unnamed protein product [Didymodactylos carnosus]